MLNMKNVAGKTETLKALNPGQSAVWICTEAGKVERDMRLFTATACRLKFKIVQSSAIIVKVNDLPVESIIITRIE